MKILNGRVGFVYNLISIIYIHIMLSFSINKICFHFIDTNFVLSNYKTDQCQRPPRLCRQGYACPQYHNSRDKRRNPRKYKYRHVFIIVINIHS